MDISKEKILAKRVNILSRQATVAIVGMVLMAIAICLFLYFLARPEESLVGFMAAWLITLIALSALRLYA